jgi:hypothetical protein
MTEIFEEYCECGRVLSGWCECGCGCARVCVHVCVCVCACVYICVCACVCVRVCGWVCTCVCKGEQGCFVFFRHSSVLQVMYLRFSTIRLCCQ